jgi:rubrerythrin
MATEENLQSAFAGESQANRKYLFFAERAEVEGRARIARLFRAAAEAETVHARNHLEAMAGIKSTRDNLLAAVEGEHHEFSQMYPGFIEQAKKEKNEPAEISFNRANKVEKIHHRLYQNALQALDAEKKLPDEPYFVCQVCGNTVVGTAPEKCPICGVPSSQFKKVE